MPRDFTLHVAGPWDSEVWRVAVGIDGVSEQGSIGLVDGEKPFPCLSHVNFIGGLIREAFPGLFPQLFLQGAFAELIIYEDRTSRLIICQV